MDTIIYDLINGNENKIYNEAGKIIRNGGIVAFPTETVYGIGANAYDDVAVKKIFKAKGRPNDNPLIVHISDKNQFNNLADRLTEDAKKIIDFFMPGPISVVVKKGKNIAYSVTNGLDTVAIRMPSNEYANKFISACNVPIAAPSANISGSPSGTNVRHVINDFNGKIDAILAGEPSSIGLESTVIDVSGEIPKLLRPGGISIEDIENLLGKRILHANKNDVLKPKSPGMKYTHYKPKANVIVLVGTEKQKIKFLNSKAKENIGVLAFDNIINSINSNIKSLSLGKYNDCAKAAQVLFDSLRKFDEFGVDVIYCEAIDTANGIGFAYMNRVLKAAGGEEISL